MKNSDIAEELIRQIGANRISSVEVADALNKTGVLEGINVYNGGHFAVGKLHYVYAHSESNWSLHEQIEKTPENSILYVDTIDCANRAVFGDLVSKYLFLYKKVRALVVNGYLRDAHRLRKEDYPIWLKGVTPLGCHNAEAPLTPETEKKCREKRALLENSVVVCDDSGCTCISEGNHTKEFLDRLNFIELQEDAWYFCIDTMKWSTFKTVCKKDYLHEAGALPEHLRTKLMPEK